MDDLIVVWCIASNVSTSTQLQVQKIQNEILLVCMHICRYASSYITREKYLNYLGSFTALILTCHQGKAKTCLQTFHFLCISTL